MKAFSEENLVQLAKENNVKLVQSIKDDTLGTLTDEDITFITQALLNNYELKEGV